MVKNFLAFLGLVFLILLVLLGAFVLTAYPDLPGQMASYLNFPASLSTPGPAQIQISAGPTMAASHKNLVDNATAPAFFVSPTPLPTPLPTFTAIPSPTATPDPVIYRTEVMIRVKRFATALDTFTSINDKLNNNPGLASDSVWQREMQTTLDEFVSSASYMGAVPSVPQEYASIQAWLEKVGPEAQKLKTNYLAGLQTGDQKYFQGVVDNKNNIIADMAQAVAGMTKAGWQY